MSARTDAAAEAVMIAAVGGHHLGVIGATGAERRALAELVSGLRPPLVAPANLTLPSLIGYSPRRREVTGAAVDAHGATLYLERGQLSDFHTAGALIEVLESETVSMWNAGSLYNRPACFTLVLGAADRAEGYRPPGSLLPRLVDRLDLELACPAADWAATVDADQVAQARARAARRLEGTPWTLARQVPARALRERHPGIRPGDLDPLVEAGRTGLISLRGAERAERTAWTIADLRDLPRPGAAEFHAALTHRLGATEPGDNR